VVERRSRPSEPPIARSLAKLPFLAKGSNNNVLSLHTNQDLAGPYRNGSLREEVGRKLWYENPIVGLSRLLRLAKPALTASSTTNQQSRSQVSYPFLVARYNTEQGFSRIMGDRDCCSGSNSKRAQLFDSGKGLQATIESMAIFARQWQRECHLRSTSTYSEKMLKGAA